MTGSSFLGLQKRKIAWPQFLRASLLVLLLALPGCSATQNEPVSLHGTWRFAEGFDVAWTRGLPVDQPQTLEIPARLGKQVNRLIGYRGWITLQKEIPEELVARARKGESLAIRTGWTGDVIRVYAGGRLVTQLGDAEPYKSAQFRYILTNLPSNFLNDPATSAPSTERSPQFLTIALYSPGDTEFELGGPIEIGPSPLVYRSFWLGEAGSLGIIAMYSTAGIFYVLLGLRRLHEPFSLYFGLLCLTACLYWFMRTGMRDLVFGEAVLARIKVEYIVLLALPPLFLIFVTQFLEQRYTRAGLGLAAWSAALALVALFGNYRIVNLVLLGFNVTTVLAIGYMLFYIVRAVMRRRPNALYLVFGMVLLAGASVFDILGVRGLHEGPEIARFALVFCVMGIAGKMARDYMKMGVSLENANRELERRYEQVNQEKETIARENDALRSLTRAVARRFVRAAPQQWIVFGSAAMQSVMELIELASRTNVPVLIEGESGTGKELVAALIHKQAGRADAPFVAVNCGAIPEALLENELFGHDRGAFTGADRLYAGRFEESNGGTLFLDEIGEMPLVLQTRLLRVLQEKMFRRLGGKTDLPWTGRLVLATHRDLEKRVKDGAFRQDLYYRIKVVTIRIPPLRERPEDVLILADYFLRKAARRLKKGRLKLTDELRSVLLSYDWPGNVRELENAILSAAIMAGDGPLTASAFPTPTRDTQPRMGLDDLASRDFDTEVGNLEKRLLTSALENAEGNQSEAARALGLTRKRLTYKIKQYQIRT
ncbi:MAG: sigma 54-interacting transcriptional regulator [Leptospirales bacterium]|nr:sigma 54-interacting transcriptional regulator [Leptospirales bacterium]